MELLGKVGWIVIGLLAPELLLFTAFNQFMTARHLTQDAQKLLRTPPITSSPGVSAGRKHRWTLTHSFYAVMGGFVLQDPHTKPDKPYLPSWQRNGVLTPQGIRFLMKHEPALFPDIPPEDILDRSKANGLAKALLVWQVLWFCFRCINRVTQHLPLCLLEVSTIAHCVCTLLTYAVWWKKPKDIEQQTVLTGDARLLGAYMSMASGRVRYFLGGISRIADSPEFADYNYIDSRLVPSERATRSIASHSVDADADELRRALAEVALNQYGTSLITYELRGFPLITPMAHLQAAISSTRNQPEMNGWLPMSIMAVVMSLAYGLPHLIGWNAAFNTSLERTLWRVATVVIMSTTVTTTAVLALQRIAETTDMFLTMLWDAFCMCWRSRRRREVHRDVKLFALLFRPIEWTVISLGAVLYVLSSGYLVAESFRQLLMLPPESFIVPSWGVYWPHFS